MGSLRSGGYTPAEITAAYGLNVITFKSSAGTPVNGNGAGETIALIEEYHDPNIRSDLSTFDSAYHLPDPSLTVVNLAGNQTDNTWALEESMDVEWAHAIAPGAKILVVEATPSNLQTTELQNQLDAVNVARNTPGVVAISMSWGFIERSSELSYDRYFTTPAGHTGITFRCFQWRLRLFLVPVGLSQRALGRRDFALTHKLGKLPIRDRLVLERRRVQPVRARAQLPVYRTIDGQPEHARRVVRRQPEYGC